MDRRSESGLPVDPVYDDSKLTDFRPEEKLGRPGEYPFIRGMYPRMLLSRPPAMRPYAGDRVIVGVNGLTAGGAESCPSLDEVCDAPRDVWGTCQPERI